MFEVINRCAEKEFDCVVGALGGVDDELRWDDGALGMEENRLLGRQVPVLPKSHIAILGAKRPKGGIPRCTVSFGGGWA